MTSTPSSALCEFSEAPTEGAGRGATVPEEVEVLLASIARRSPISAAESSPMPAFSNRVEGEPNAPDTAQTIRKSPAEPSKDTKIRSAVLKSKQPPLRRRAVRSLITFCMGVAAAFAWQSYGDATREMIASSYPQFGWLAPQLAFAETPHENVPPTAPATTSDVSITSEEIKSILVNLGVVRERVDWLAAEVVASQQQVESDIAKLKETEQNIFDKISSPPPPRPVATPARKPAPAPAP